MRVAPNHVLVGEKAITLTGEPRLQGGPGSSVRLAKLPTTMPLRTTRRGDGKGVKIAVLDTGLFDHQWLTTVQRAAGSNDVWDVEPDQYADNESGHGTFIAGLILQVAPAAEVYVVKVLDSHGVGDDATVAQAMEQLPQDIDIVNLSLGGYTDDDAAPLAIACALQIMRKQRSVVVAAAGNNASSRPFWPAAFKQVLAVGAVEQKTPQWFKAGFSNYGWWVDAAARGVNLESTFAKGKTKAAQGDTPQPATDPTWTFDGWAAWDGTSFASPITAAVLARTMSRNGSQHGRGREGPPAGHDHRRHRSRTSRSRCWWTSCCPRSWSRGSRSACPARRRAAARRPARRPSSTKRPSSSAWTDTAVLARPLDRHRRGCGRQQLPFQAARALGRSRSPRARSPAAATRSSAGAARGRCARAFQPPRPPRRRCRASARRARRPRSAR